MHQGSFFRRSIRRSVAIGSMLAFVGLASGASAQDAPTSPGLALNRFNVSPAGDRMYGVQSAYVAGALTPHASLLFDYARNPLLMKYSDGSPVGAVVSDQLFLHLNVGFSFANRVNVNVSYPLALAQAGDSPTGGGLTFTSPDGVAGGDLRFGARVNLVGTYWSPFQLALGGYVWLPTGNSEPGSFVGEGARALPQVIAGGRVKETFVWSFDLGPDLRRAVVFGGPAGTPQGNTLRTGAGLGFLIGEGGNLQIGPEVTAGLVLNNENDTPARRSTNLEVMLGARYRFMQNFEAGVGIGTGLTSAIGTPQLRAIGMISYTPLMKKAEPPKPTPKPMDSDGDGIIDDKDACKEVKGVENADPAKNGCPPDTDGDGIIDANDACVQVVGVRSDNPAKNGCPPDTDGDGIIDVEDACPQVKGVASPDKAKNGCPPDRDEDGVIDAEDACVDIKGLKTSDPATNGCPGDTDGDTIRDDKDACPNEKGKADPDPTKNGCPVAVRVTETEVIILQQVQFDTARATIKKMSDPLLDEVAGVFKEHPEITKIEVQGHTDDRGLVKQNKKLSQDRADSVKKALIKRGIEADRLVPKGFGQDKPVGDNKTEAGRQQNRRVQFFILEKVPKGSVPAPASAAPEAPKSGEVAPAKP